MSREEFQKRRFEACLNGLPRSLNSNINPAFLLPRRGFEPAIWTGGDVPTSGPVVSESLSRYQFRVTPINKDAHLRKDDIKRVRVRELNANIRTMPRPRLLTQSNLVVAVCGESHAAP